MPQRLPPVLTADTAKKLLNGKMEVSLDLGLTTTRTNRTKDEIRLTSRENIDYVSLGKMAEKEDVAYFVSGGEVYQVAISGKHFYKLVPTGGAPTLEIDGIRMHRTKETTPDVDTGRKLDSLGLRGGAVLDTCTGLGYTAIEAVRRGASQVVTVEIEPSVLLIAMMNPWSRGLWTRRGIHKLLGDSFQVVDGLPEGFFDYVVHDPPRHGHAGHLYGGEFHRKLWRVMKPGGRLFHYTGEPGSRYRGVDLGRGVAARLRETGFVRVSYHDDVMGFTAVKP
jgi:predicted methyltransferase